MTDKPDFIEIDAESDEQALIDKYLELTGKDSIYPAQAERILISLIAYYANLVKTQFNEAAALNLVQFSRAPILDFIGALFGCTRLDAEYGTDELVITLYEAFSYDFTISAGLEVQTSDGEYTFKTTEDVTIPAGDTTATVTIQSETAGSAVNDYEEGTINVLIKPYSYIKSVTNLNGVSGGLDEESDEDYRERILMAPESYTCAGSWGAYIYHTKSVSQNIVDVEAESPQIPATITIDGETVDADSVDYTTGEVTFTYNNSEIVVTVPPAASVYVYPLVAEGADFDTIKTAVEEKLTDRDCMPMTDYINVVEPTALERELNITVTLDDDIDTDSVKSDVTAAIDTFVTEHRNTLNAALVPLKLLTAIGNIEGVYNVSLNDFAEIEECNINEYFVITYNLEFIEG